MNIISLMHKAEKDYRKKAADHPEYKAFSDLAKNHINQNQIIDMLKNSYKATNFDAQNVGKKIHNLLSKLEKGKDFDFDKHMKDNNYDSVNRDSMTFSNDRNSIDGHL